MAQRILALEMAGDQVRAAVAERTWDTFKLLDTFEAERNSGEPDMSGALSRLVAEAGHPDIVISALPGELVANRVLSLPFKEDRKLRQVVPFALEEHLPFPVDDAVATFTRIGQDSEGTIVLAAVVRKKIFELISNWWARPAWLPSASRWRRSRSPACWSAPGPKASATVMAVRAW